MFLSSISHILIGDSGDITGIIDWECTVAAPHRQACKLPQVLNGGDDDCVPEPLSALDKGDEEAVECHDEAVYDYEATQLRRYFLEEMARFDLE